MLPVFRVKTSANNKRKPVSLISLSPPKVCVAPYVEYSVSAINYLVDYTFNLRGLSSGRIENLSPQVITEEVSSRARTKFHNF